MSEGFDYINARSVLSPDRMEELTRFVDGFRGIDEILTRGWIAGGFVRMVLLEKCKFINYFVATPHWYSGDIDFFFPSAEAAAGAISSFISTGGIKKPESYLYKSKGGFAQEAVLKVSGGEREVSVKAQFVCDEKMCFPTIEACLGDFDFLNCRVGLRLVGGELQFVIAKGWREAEEAGILHVMNNKSPFLGKRIMKYLDRRELTSLSPDSADIITGWLINVANGMFPGFRDTHTESLHDVVKELRSDKIVKDEHLILFLNKWKETEEVSHGYGRTYVRDMGDWALNEIDKVNGGTGRKNNIDEEEEW